MRIIVGERGGEVNRGPPQHVRSLCAELALQESPYRLFQSTNEPQMGVENPNCARHVFLDPRLILVNNSSLAFCIRAAHKNAPGAEKGEVVFDFVYLSFLQTFEVPVRNGMSTEELQSTLRHAGFDATWAASTAREFRIAEDFLLSKDLAGGHIRCELDAFHLVVRKKVPPTDRQILVRPILTVYPSLDIGILCFFCKLEHCSADDVIFVSQSMRGGHEVEVILPSIVRGNEADVSTRRLFSRYVDPLRWCLDVGAKSCRMDEGLLIGAHLIEIRITRAENHDTPTALAASRPREIYGMLAMDEGWRHVPKELAVERIGRPWRTREHLWVVAFARGVLMIDRQYHPNSEYVQSQQELRATYHAKTKDYFGFMPDVAGLNHGPLLMLETCTIRTSFLMHLHADVRRERPKTITALLQMRSRLVERLAHFDLLPIREIGILEGQMLEGMLFDRVMEDITRVLAQIEAELTIMYTRKVNRMITSLTVLSVIWTVIGSIAAVVSLIGGFNDTG